MKLAFLTKGGLLSGMGMGMVGVALAIDKKLVIVTGIGLIAVLFKLLVIPIVRLL